MDVSQSSFQELAEEWIRNVSKELQITSVSNYRHKLERHVIPYFAGLKYCEVTPEKVRLFAQSLQEKGYSRKYREDILVVLRMVTRYVSRAYCLSNPADSIILPKRSVNFRLKSGTLTESMQKRLCSCLLQDTDLTKAGIYLTMMTGMRLGELCGLQWAHIDLTGGEILVEQTLQRITEGTGTRLALSEIKEGAARRRIPVTETVTQCIGRFQRAPERFFLTGALQPADPRTMQNRLKAIIKSAGLPEDINFNSLRNTFVESCARLGMDAMSLSRLLGNSTLSMPMEYCKGLPVQGRTGIILAMREKELL